MKKVIILTHPLATNYGGLLQAYALQKTITSMGYDVVTARTIARLPVTKFYLRLYIPLVKFKMKISGETKVEEGKRRIRSQNTDKFINRYIRNVEFFNGKKHPTKKIADKYDIYIVGSDQVWRKEYMNLRSYFLDFLSHDKTKKKIAYAASFGVDSLKEWTEREVRDCSRLIGLFDAVSVREMQGAKLCSNLLGREAQWVLDPTMLLSKDQYNEIIPQRDNRIPRGVFTYILDADGGRTEIVNKIAKTLHLEVCHFISDDFEKLSTGLGPTEFVFPSVEDWLQGIRDAQFVVTDSFHGTIFSIIFNKPFVSVANKQRGYSRFSSLLKLFGLENRLVSDVSELSDSIYNPIDYAAINRLVGEKKEESLNFLRMSLDSKNE